ncbi:MAG TPA: flagellar basal body L-ring protein FlgH [Candidatus Aquilonibacter sp.]|nr:flagellar basal body L-ring protein FlgH [Candidatus Aquilonibacter sp.]
MRRAIAVMAMMLLAPVTASADTLYQAAPPPAGPGHPLRLTADPRAQQIGDLVYVVFDFSDSNSHSNNYSSNKQFNTSLAGGTGNFALALLKNTSALGGQSTTSTAQSANGADSFVSTMMATVTDVLPSGAMVITGDQDVNVNGRKQTLHITGTIRPQDVSQGDSILASRVANVHADFKGNDIKDKGLLSRIVSWLF